jgi:hypothetical protein
MPANYEVLYRSMTKQRAFAWAKYYEAMNTQLGTDHRYYTTITSAVESFPAHVKTEMEEMAAALKKRWECPVCLDFIASGSLEITPCGHYYCKDCVGSIKAGPEPKCAICRKKLKATVWHG